MPVISYGDSNIIFTVYHGLINWTVSAIDLIINYFPRSDGFYYCIRNESLWYTYLRRLILKVKSRLRRRDLCEDQSGSEWGDLRVLRSSSLAKNHDLNAAAVPAITLATRTCLISDCLIFTSWLIANFTIIRAREKNIAQPKTIYAMLRNSKPTVALFFRFIYFILNCIADKFTIYSTNKITSRNGART